MQISRNRFQVLPSLATAALLLAFLLSTPIPSSAAITKTKKSVDATCMQTAIAARETDLMEAFVAFNETVVEGLTERKEALSTAWGLSEVSARNTAVKSAWSTWKTTKKEAHMDLKSERKTAWDTFKTTAKNSCKLTVPKEESLEKDTSGTVTL